MREGTSLKILCVLKKIRNYFEQLYANECNNLDEVYKFFERHRLPKQTQEEMKTGIKKLNYQLKSHLQRRF